MLFAKNVVINGNCNINNFRRLIMKIKSFVSGFVCAAIIMGMTPIAIAR